MREIPSHASTTDARNWDQREHAAQPIHRPSVSLPGQLGPLIRGQPAGSGPGVEFGLLEPRPHRGLGQVEIRRDLPDRAVTALTQLDDLGLELGRERPAAASIAFFPTLSMMLDILPETLERI
jgi:hypothetical protein